MIISDSVHRLLEMKSGIVEARCVMQIVIQGAYTAAARSDGGT
jgi:hypothetical protein